ncbi:MAG: hypothetical protein RL648_251, partial [Verrucomicrobiota bacterium]
MPGAELNPKKERAANRIGRLEACREFAGHPWINAGVIE